VSHLPSSWTRYLEGGYGAPDSWAMISYELRVTSYELCHLGRSEVGAQPDEPEEIGVIDKPHLDPRACWYLLGRISGGNDRRSSKVSGVPAGFGQL
jgi:hypothetical protein